MEKVEQFLLPLPETVLRFGSAQFILNQFAVGSY